MEPPNKKARDERQADLDLLNMPPPKPKRVIIPGGIYSKGKMARESKSEPLGKDPQQLAKEAAEAAECERICNIEDWKARWLAIIEW